ncbi:MAG: hypothetical protein ACYCZR_01075 [Burkholderiales bacterium]
MPEVKWISEAGEPPVPAMTLDDLEAWLRGQFSVHHTTNLLELRDHLLSQVQAMKEGQTA